MRQIALRGGRQAGSDDTAAATSGQSAPGDAAVVENDVTLSSVGPGQVVSIAGIIANDVSLGTGATLTEPGGQSLSVFGAIDGPTTGTATVSVAAAGTLYLAGPVAASVSAGFGGSGGTLQLADLYLQSMLGSIGGFAIGNVIDVVSGTVTDATVTTSGSAQSLVLADEGAVVATLTLADSDAVADVAFAIPDPIDGTRIVLGQALPATSSTVSSGTPTGSQFVWNGGLGGQWDSAGAWSMLAGGGATIAPGLHDSATIAGPQSSVLVVAGNAAAATLTTQGLVALAGSFAVTAVVAGSAAADDLILTAGAQLQAATLSVEAGVVQVAAADATLSVSAPTIAGGGTLWVADAGLATLAGLVLTGGVVRLGTTGAITIGNASQTAGLLGVGAGGGVSGSGTIDAPVGNAGSIQASGTLQIYGSVTGSGSLAIGAAAELYLPLGAGPGQQIGFAGSGGTLELFGSASSCAGTITGFGVGDVIDIASDTVSQDAWTPGSSGAPGTLDLGSSGTLALTLAANLSAATASFTLSADGLGGTDIEVVPCFCAGTRLRRPGGVVTVEALRVGDRLLTSSGAARRVRWIGRRHYSADELEREPQLRPVRIGRHALGPGAPAAPVWLSPQHGVALATSSGLRLVPAIALADGDAVRRGGAAKGVTYFHVELDDHDLLLSSGLALESYHPQGPEDRRLFTYCAGTSGIATGVVAPRLEDGPELEWLRATLGLDPPFRSAARVDRGRPEEFRGCIDRVERLGTTVAVEGWAAPLQATDAPVWLALAIHANQRAGWDCGLVVANRWRPDLDRAGIAWGRAGFRATLPLPRGATAITVRARIASPPSAAARGDPRLRTGHGRGEPLTLIG